MYKTSLLATGGFNEKCGILGVGTKQFTLSLEEFKDALYLLNYKGSYIRDNSMNTNITL